MRRMWRDATALCDDTELSSDDQISRLLPCSSVAVIPRDAEFADDGRDNPCAAVVVVVVVVVVASLSSVIVTAS